MMTTFFLLMALAFGLLLLPLLIIKLAAGFFSLVGSVISGLFSAVFGLLTGLFAALFSVLLLVLLLPLLILAAVASSLLPLLVPVLALVGFIWLLSALFSRSSTKALPAPATA